MSAYTDANKIAAYLGVTLTSDQQTQAGIAAEAATAWIDEYKGQSWQDDDGTVTDELHELAGDTIYLEHRPVTAVSAVSTRQRMVGATWLALTTSQYELFDPANGVLLLSGWVSGCLDVRVSYTHTATSAPSNVAFAATIIAASLLGPTLRPNTDGLESVAVGQNDVNVKFRVEYGSVPEKALTLLGGRAVVIA